MPHQLEKLPMHTLLTKQRCDAPNHSKPNPCQPAVNGTANESGKKAKVAGVGQTFCSASVASVEAPQPNRVAAAAAATAKPK